LSPKTKLLFLAILIALMMGIQFPVSGGYYLQCSFIIIVTVGLYGLLTAIAGKVKHRTENKKSSFSNHFISSFSNHFIIGKMC
jgi:hypothetical protein